MWGDSRGRGVGRRLALFMSRNIQKPRNNKTRTRRVLSMLRIGGPGGFELSSYYVDYYDYYDFKFLIGIPTGIPREIVLP